jgi:CHAD domain-containing protein
VEGVHQMRVALRRMRAALVLFRELIGPARENQLAEEVRWLARILGSARDWDVFGDTLLDPLSVSQGQDKGLQALLRQAAERRAQAYDSVAAALDSPRYAALSFAIAALAAELAEADAGGALTTEAFAVRALQTRHAKLLRRGRHIEKLDSPERHQLRIELKKLRYRVDFFRSAFLGKRRKNFVTDLRELQDVFGVLNDIATGKRLAAELFAAAPADARAAGGRGLVTGYLIASDRFWRDRLLAQWEAFVEARPYWR